MLQEFAAGAEGLGSSAGHHGDGEEEVDGDVGGNDDGEEEVDCVDDVASLSGPIFQVGEFGCSQTLAMVHSIASVEDIVQDIGGLAANYNTHP